MKSVLFGTPVHDSVLPEYVMSLVGGIQYLNGKLHGGLIIYRTPLISAGRNFIVKYCDSDYLMFIDSDMIFPPDGVWRLIERDKDIIGGLYYGKNTPNKPIIYNINENDRFEFILDIPKEPFELDGIGTGFMLIKRKVLDAFTPEVCAKLGKPFNLRQKPDGSEEGEDLAFCRRAKTLGFEVWCDPTITLGHVGHEIYDHRHYNANLTIQSLKESKIEYRNNIEGWMADGELDWLYKQAKKMNSIVEIGSWKGKSTHALLSGCKGTVTAIDHFQGSKNEERAHKEAKERDIFQDFMKNVGEFKNLKVLKMPSDEALELVEEADMIFIDGEHTYEAVKNDIKKWLPKAKKLICGHDYNWLTVRQAVNEVLGEVKSAGTIWYKEIE
jgi:predicted O-methyltransferase YrrM